MDLLMPKKKNVSEFLATTRKLKKGVHWVKEEKALIWKPEWKEEDQSKINQLVTIRH